MKKITLISFLFSFILFFNACEKKETDTETDSAVDNTIAEAEFTAILPAVSEKAVTKSGAGQLKIVNAYFGPLITVDSSVAITGSSNNKWPRLMTICYDTLFDEANANQQKTYMQDGITGDDQKTRKGILRCLVYGPWNDNYAVMKIKDVDVNGTVLKGMDKYIVNGIKYEATLIEISKDVAGNADVKKLKVVGGKCSTALWNIQWSTDRTVTTEFAGDPMKEVITVIGTASGVSRLGLGYTTTITSPLVKYTKCAQIGKGTIQITPSGKEPRIIDYGDGTCDNKATLTIKGVKFSFNL